MQLVALRSDLLHNYDSYENKERQNMVMQQWTKQIKIFDLRVGFCRKLSEDFLLEKN